MYIFLDHFSHLHPRNNVNIIIIMSTFSPTSTNFMFSLRLLTISSSLCLLAILLKLSLPQLLTTFAFSNDFSSIFNFLSSCLKPPYLYLVINFIIITIVATSKLQSKFDHDAFPQPPPVVSKTDDDEVAAFHHFSFSPPPPAVKPKSSDGFVNTAATSPLFDYGYAPEKVSEFSEYVQVDGRVLESENVNVGVKNELEDDAPPRDFDKIEKQLVDAEDSNYVKVMNLTSSNKVISRAPAAASLMEFSKPPASSRFGHRKLVKTTPDHQGGKTLKVSKPKRHETLESTWKTITDGRPMPLTRHLRKSDTWENHPAHTTNALDFQDHSKMTKSETFNDGTIGKKNISTSSRSSGSGKLKKDPSLSQDELNKRVEAFITKFNEDMRLQRQESLNQYMEMINRGAGP